MKRVLTLVGVGLILLGTQAAFATALTSSPFFVMWTGVGKPPETPSQYVGEVAVDTGGPLVTRTLVLVNNTLFSGNFPARNGLAPVNAAYDSGKGELFVADFSSHTVSVISDVTREILATIPVDINPNGMAYDSGKGEVFVANTGSNTVSVISDATNTVVATISMGAFASPSGVAYDSGKGEVFVVNTGLSSVSVISDATNTVVATIPGGTSPAGLTYDGTMGEVFVANYGSDTVSVISDATNTVVATIPINSSPFVSNPYGVVYDSGKNEVFVTNQGPGRISVISDATNTVVATIQSIGGSSSGLAYDSGKGEVFVTSGIGGGSLGSLSVISDATNTVVASTQVGDSPVGVAYDSGNGHLDVSNLFQGTISIISPRPPSITSFTANPSIVLTGEWTNLTVVASGVAGTLAYSYSGLPPGCVSSTTSTLPCRPMSAGTFNVTVSVTDNDGRTAKAFVLLVVKPSTIFGLEPTLFFIGIALAVAVAVVTMLLMVRRKTRRQTKESATSAG